MERFQYSEDLRPGTDVRAAQRFCLSVEGLDIVIPAGSKVRVTHPLGGALVDGMAWVRAQIGEGGELSQNGLMPLELLRSFRQGQQSEGTEAQQ